MKSARSKLGVKPRAQWLHQQLVTHRGGTHRQPYTPSRRVDSLRLARSIAWGKSRSVRTGDTP
jgi:hypothetical protein